MKAVSTREGFASVVHLMLRQSSLGVQSLLLVSVLLRVGVVVMTATMAGRDVKFALTPSASPNGLLPVAKFDNGGRQPPPEPLLRPCPPVSETQPITLVNQYPESDTIVLLLPRTMTTTARSSEWPDLPLLPWPQVVVEWRARPQGGLEVESSIPFLPSQIQRQPMKGRTINARATTSRQHYLRQKAQQVDRWKNDWVIFLCHSVLLVTVVAVAVGTAFKDGRRFMPQRMIVEDDHDDSFTGEDNNIDNSVYLGHQVSWASSDWTGDYFDKFDL